VSVEAIAAEAGVSKVTVYSHFPNGKEEVFVAAISAGCAALFDGAFVSVDSGGDLESALAQLGADFVSMITSDEVAALHAVMLGEGVRKHPALPKLFYENAVRRLTLDLAERLKREAARGVIACPEPEMAAEQFLAMVQGQIVYRIELGVGPTPEAERRRYARACAALFMRGHQP
jgi:TetR/AcrR family transcriptional repressor of mexJK operon